MTYQAPFIWRKVASGRTVTRLPELPWASQHFLDFLTGTWRTVTRETKRLARLEPFFDGKVSLLAGRTRGH